MFDLQAIGKTLPGAPPSSSRLIWRCQWAANVYDLMRHAEGGIGKCWSGGDSHGDVSLIHDLDLDGIKIEDP